MQLVHQTSMLSLATLMPLLLLSFLESVTAARDMHTYCGACLGMIDELNMAVQSVDPKKKIQVGSFRVDPKGNQNLREIPYSRSEVHLTEVLEDICNRMTNFGEYTDESKGKKYILRRQSLDGTPIAMKNVNIDGNLHQLLKFACNAIIEEHEDDLLKLAMKDDKDIETKYCVKITGACTPAVIQERLWVQAQAVMAGMQEQQEKLQQEAADAAKAAAAEEEEEEEEEEEGEEVEETNTKDQPEDVNTNSEQKEEL